MVSSTLRAVVPDGANLKIQAKSNSMQMELDESLKALFGNRALQAELDLNMEALFRDPANCLPGHLQDDIMTIIFGDEPPVVSAPSSRKKVLATKAKKRAVLEPLPVRRNDNDTQRAKTRRNPARRGKITVVENENVQSTKRRNPSRRAKLPVVNEPLKPKSKPTRGNRATRNTRGRKAKEADDENEAFKRQVLEELVDCKQRLNTFSPQLNDLRSKSFTDQIPAEARTQTIDACRIENSSDMTMEKDVDVLSVQKEHKKKKVPIAKQASSASAFQVTENVLLSTPVDIDVEPSPAKATKSFAKEVTGEISVNIVEESTRAEASSTNSDSANGISVNRKGRHMKTTSKDKTSVTVISDNVKITEIANDEPEIVEMEIDSPLCHDTVLEKAISNDEETASAPALDIKMSSLKPNISSMEVSNSPKSSDEPAKVDDYDASVHAVSVPSNTELQEASAEPSEKSNSTTDTKSQKVASKPPAVPKTQTRVEPPKTPNNEFKVNEDGKISAASIGKLQCFGTSDLDKNEAPLPAKHGIGAKSNKLFKQSLYSSGNRPPFAGSSRKPMSAAASSGVKLASITPGLRKPLDLGLQNATTEKAAGGINIATSLFPQPVAVASACIEDAKKKISFAGLPESSVPEKIEIDAAVEERTKAKNSVHETTVSEEMIEEKTISEKAINEKSINEKAAEKAAEERLFTKSIFAAPSPVQKVRKAAASKPRLFEKSIFAAPSPELVASKKSISFASHAKLTNHAGVQTEVSVGAVSKKRFVSADEDEPSSPAVVKRPRISAKSLTSKSVTTKSALRERIESLRKRPGYKSIGTPASIAPVTPAALSTKFHTHLSPLRTPAVPSSTLAVHQQPSLDDTHSMASPSSVAPAVDSSPVVMKSSAEDLRSSLSSNKNAPASSSDVVPSSSMDAILEDGEQNLQSNNDPHTSAEGDDENTGVLSNLMTSVKSFMPASAASFFGYKPDDSDVEETEEERAERIAEESRIDAERREAEIVARRKAAQQQRQTEAEEKRRRVEEKRKEILERKRRKDEEIKRKEAQRIKRLREDLDARKKKKEEDERKREQRHQRVREHQKMVAAAEAARRAEADRNDAARRAAKTGRGKAGGSASGAGSSKMPMSDAKARAAGDAVRSTPGTQRTLFHDRKKDEVTSYEMSAERPHAEESSDDESEDKNSRGKKIPDWARNANVLKALATQNDDPDKTFARVHSVNLEDVFASTQNMKKRYRTRNSSGQWTRDRLTAREEMEYKKRAGFI